jgi:D-mannonate dehydratase
MKNMKFEEQKLTTDDIVVCAYQHVDNGGHTVMVDKYHNVHISTGNFGYSNVNLMLGTVDLDGLIEALQKAKRRLEELAVMRKLKGE